jgi:hypothetical protein
MKLLNANLFIFILVVFITVIIMSVYDMMQLVLDYPKVFNSYPAISPKSLPDPPT